MIFKIRKKSKWVVHIYFVILLFVGINNMQTIAKPKNLSSEFKIPIAEKELELQVGQVPMGLRRGGLNMYSNKFKRGYGNNTFGSDENGIWLGLAEFDNAPFRVDMEGALNAKSATFVDGNDTTIVDSGGLVSTANFENGFVGAGLSQVITSSIYVDVTSATLTTENFGRNKKIFVFGNISSTADAQSGVYFDGYALFALVVDDTVRSEMMKGYKKIDNGDGTVNEVGTLRSTESSFEVLTLGTGTHTVKLQARVVQGGVGNSEINLKGYDLGYFVLGN